MKAILYILFMTFVSSGIPTEQMPQSQRAIKQSDTMERTVILIRHAKSSHDNPELRDFDRPLNPRGYRDAPFMGEKLKEKGENIDLIIASPSQRTTETIHLICKQIGYPIDQIHWDRSVYLSTSENLKRIIRSLDDSIKTVAIVGHNPSMTMTANALQSNEEIENVPTTGIVSVRFNAKTWKEALLTQGKLDYFIYPKKYSK